MRAEDHPPPEVNIYTDNGEKVPTKKFSKKIKRSELDNKITIPN